VEALEDVLALLRRDARPLVGDRDAGGARGGGRGDGDHLPLRAVAERVVEQDPHHARDGVGVAAAPAALGRRHHAQLDVELARAQVELGGHRPHQLAELDRLRAELDRRVEPAEVEQLARQRGEPPQLAARVGDLELGVLDVHATVAQILLEQLHRALEHGQRGAQLVRRGGDERAPGGLLAAQRLLHAGERAGEVADLVAALVARRGGVGALGGDPQGGGAQAREPPQQGAREGDGERDRHQHADAGAGQQRLADLVGGRHHLGQAALGDEHAVGARRRVVQPHRHRDLVALDPDDRAVLARGLQGGERGVLRRGREVGVVEEVRRRVVVVVGVDQHARVDPALELEGGRADLGLAGAERGGARGVVLPDRVGDLALERGADLGGGDQHGVLQVVDALVAQLVLQRAEHDRADHRQREHRGEHEGHQQASAEAARQHHGSRNR
jgi:hypothetical protein